MDKTELTRLTSISAIELGYSNETGDCYYPANTHQIKCIHLDEDTAVRQQTDVSAFIVYQDIVQVYDIAGKLISLPLHFSILN